MEEKDKRPKAVALLSGGLDSTLAILVLLRQGVDVHAITFLTHFGCDITDSSSCSRDPFPAARKFGFQLKLAHLADKFFEIVKNPKFGHGKNMNPCVDCRILMLREAKTYMELIGADFLVTGEVLGQRPMSQRRDSFPLIDREAGVAGLVLRPLSAKLLPETIPEREGLVDRERLFGFRGRTRRPQMALAEKLGLTEYPTPAGGCLLTEPTYAWRLRELLEHNPGPSLRDIELLRTGRHFRLSREARLIVGRNHEENEKIAALTEPGDTVLTVEGVGSPLSLLAGRSDVKTLRRAAEITARYSDAKGLPAVKVTVRRDDYISYLTVPPAVNDILDELRIAAPEGGKKWRKRKRRAEVPRREEVSLSHI
jgi:tRNA U34 2-thiouridine synthase MnmA/TrmU